MQIPDPNNALLLHPTRMKVPVIAGRAVHACEGAAGTTIIELLPRRPIARRVPASRVKSPTPQASVGPPDRTSGAVGDADCSCRRQARARMGDVFCAQTRCDASPKRQPRVGPFATGIGRILIGDGPMRGVERGSQSHGAGLQDRLRRWVIRSRAVGLPRGCLKPGHATSARRFSPLTPPWRETLARVPRGRRSMAGRAKHYACREIAVSRAACLRRGKPCTQVLDPERCRVEIDESHCSEARR